MVCKFENQCPNNAVVRVYDNTNGGGWPEGGGGYDLPGRSTGTLTLKCRSGASICYGAITVINGAQGGVVVEWGLGLHGGHCSDCCAPCADTEIPVVLMCFGV